MRECFERNKLLIDLNAQPNDIKNAVDQRIKESVRVNTTPQVGVHFMRFCGKYELNKLSEQASAYSNWLNAHYQGVLCEG